MKFLQRLKLYLIGFGLGVIVVYFYFRDRDIGDWLPKNQIINRLNNSDITFSSHVDCMAACLDLPEAWMDSFLVESNINFKESDAQHEPCPVYKMTSTSLESDFSILVESCDSTAVVTRILNVDIACGCN